MVAQTQQTTEGQLQPTRVQARHAQAAERHAERSAARQRRQQENGAGSNITGQLSAVARSRV